MKTKPLILYGVRAENAVRNLRDRLPPRDMPELTALLAQAKRIYAAKFNAKFTFVIEVEFDAPIGGRQR